MTVLTRRQFRQYWEDLMPGLGDDGSVLWVMEQHYNKKSRWFVKTRPIVSSELIKHDQATKRSYWLWCTKNCAGQILCYSSSREEEWWGFSHHADLVPWMLKWSQ